VTRDHKPASSIQHRASSFKYRESRIENRGSSIEYPASRSRPFIIPIFIPHAGCPHQCVFCNQVSITGVKQNTVRPDQFRRQIRQFLEYKKDGRKPVQIAFFGGNFLGLKPEEIKSWLELAGEFVSQGLVDGIRFSTRPDTIDTRRLDILENYPVATVELGVQSMDDQVLVQAGRGHLASDTRYHPGG
jgi:histone acetyltransferase (RNA polymerase elongator complex component)